MKSVSSVSAAVAEISGRFTGHMVQPTDTAYDEVRCHG
jgi:hypothetical protein